MTFLEICQRVREESGVSGSGPVTVDNQTAMLAKIIRWVQQADLDIQRLHDAWKFRWAIDNVELTNGERTYDRLALGLTDLQSVKTMRIDAQPVREMDWQLFLSRRYDTDQQQAQPQVYTVRPDGLIVFYPEPDDDYQVTLEYVKDAVRMELDQDVSPIPERYHDAIMQKALMYYANHEEDNDLFQKAQYWYESALSEMAASELPRITMNRGNLF